MSETTFDFDAADDEQPDVYVTETFVNEYNDERAVLDGETYDAKDVIKFDWDVTHHSFDDDKKAWIVDADALDELEAKLADEGFTFDDGADVDEGDETLEALCDALQEDDEITVRYEMKNGNGENSYSGTVTVAEVGEPANPDDPYDQGSTTGVVFEDGDGKTKKLRTDDTGTPSLFSSGYHPFMGTLNSVTVARDVDTPDETDADENDAEDDESVRTDGGQVTTSLLESALEDMRDD